ncbi:hypothetical protein ABLT32_09105 [Bacteroides pyogenes]|uniref:hypothetical protein n=4 Tax=Bacteroides pyogenes TaxID=310300 RepID=UPI001BAC2B94|nr:hypothetical protein [Bacteroides pyogenes]
MKYTSGTGFLFFQTNEVKSEKARRLFFKARRLFFKARRLFFKARRLFFKARRLFFKARRLFFKVSFEKKRFLFSKVVNSTVLLSNNLILKYNLLNNTCMKNNST